MDVGVEDCAAQQRGQNFGEQKVRDRPEPISGCRMARHIHAQAAQLLNQPPDFGAVRRNLLRDFGSANYDGGIFHQETDDAAQADIGGVAGFCGRVTRFRTSCLGFLDAGIMRDAGRKHKPQAFNYERHQGSIKSS